MFGELLRDRVASAKQQNRRTKEAQRREIIFNEKERTIGIDKEALDLQLKEKKLRDEEEKQTQKASDAEMLHCKKVASILAHRQQKQQQEMAKDIDSFREKYQQPPSRREFDLNDPQSLKNLTPEEAQMMISGLTGEDPNSKERQQRQREQLRDWIIQQHAERQGQRHKQEMEDQNYDQFIVEVNNMALELQKLEMEKRKEEIIANKDFNLAMSEEKRRQETKEKDSSDLDFIDGEVIYMASSHSDPGTERQEIIKLKQFHQQQMEEKKRQIMREKDEAEDRDRVRADSARTAALIERQQAKLNKQMRKHLDSANLTLAETRKPLKPDIARGAVTESFFSQFNTCSR